MFSESKMVGEYARWGEDHLVLLNISSINLMLFSLYSPGEGKLVEVARCFGSNVII